LLSQHGIEDNSTWTKNVDLCKLNRDTSSSKERLEERAQTDMKCARPALKTDTVLHIFGGGEKQDTSTTARSGTSDTWDILLATVALPMSTQNYSYRLK
jgi:hypothetical protein